MNEDTPTQGSSGDDGDQNGESSASPELTKRYLWGQAVDQLLTQETVDDGGPEDVSYIVRDNLGSTRSLVESSGSVVSTFSYDSYGNVTVPLGSITDTRFLYTCQEYDLQTGLSYYNARWYSPTLGRFISEDPMGFAAGDTNLYRYVGNNSTTYADPSGLCEESGGAASDLLFRIGETPLTIQRGPFNASDYSGLAMARMLNAASDLVFRPGDMPVKAELGNLIFSDYDGMNMIELLNFGTDLVFRPGETPVTADNGSFDLRNYKGQLRFELLADKLGSSEGFRKWTIGGHSTEAKLVEVRGDLVILETANGNRILVSKNGLSKSDQAILEEFQQPKKELEPGHSSSGVIPVTIAGVPKGVENMKAYIKKLLNEPNGKATIDAIRNMLKKQSPQQWKDWVKAEKFAKARWNHTLKGGVTRRISVVGSLGFYNDFLRFINWLNGNEKNWCEDPDELAPGEIYENIWDGGIYQKPLGPGRPIPVT